MLPTPERSRQAALHAAGAAVHAVAAAAAAPPAHRIEPEVSPEKGAGGTMTA
jgi:hypothetical protein